MRTAKIIVILLSLLAPVYLFGQKLRVADTRTDYRLNPSGVESRQPALSWQLISSSTNVMQTAYRILVSDNPTALAKNSGNIWDTKKLHSAQSIRVIYSGPALQATKTYYWKVMVWDNQKNVSAWSEQASWQMGLLDRSDWKDARWIGYEKMPDSMLLTTKTAEFKRTAAKDILPLFRKEFKLKKKVKKATLFISGLGHFEASINGEKIGDHFLDPGWTDYTKEALYVSFDITRQLKQGDNAIGVMLGNGFYFIPGDRYRKLQLAYGFPTAICRMLVEYADGTTANIISDTSWKATPGPITFSSIYGGEDYNANLEQKGWKNPGFNDKQWKNVIITDGPPALYSQTAEPLKIFNHFAAKKITQPSPGVSVYDFGQNASGIPSIALKGKKGSTVRLWPSELLDKNGLITTEFIGKPVYFEYTLKGDGIETWQPQFMYYGFRYVQVEGAVPEEEKNPDGLPVIILLKSLHTSNAAERAGEFSCSNELFNKTDVLIDWAIRSNMASVLTDCPHREKLGWLEEAHLVGPSIRYNYNIATLCRKLIRDMMSAQTKEGLVPNIAPRYAEFWEAFSDSPEWGSNCVIMPWYMYEWYGDKQILEEAYPMMKKYVAYLQSKSKEGILTHGLGDWYDIGPKEPGPSQLTPRGITATAMYYYDLTLMSKVAALLGKEQEASLYEEMAVKIKKIYNTAFFNPTTKQYGTGSQTSNAMSVYMELVEPKYKDSVMNNIVKQLRNNNNAISAGDIGFRYLLRVLDDNGRSDVIYDMNSNADVPGYGYQLKRGATSLTESWQAYANSSNNHMMLGHIKEWFFSGLGGIRAAKNAVGFNQIEIRPQPAGNVTHAKATYISPYGLVASDWKRETGYFELAIEIPANTTALVFLPAQQTALIKQDGKILDKSLVQFEKGKVLIKVGSGKYRFEVNN